MRLAMPTPGPDDGTHEALRELVQAMHDMRDALQLFTFVLQDHRFEHDQQGRLHAAQQSEALIQRSRDF